VVRGLNGVGDYSASTKELLMILAIDIGGTKIAAACFQNHQCVGRRQVDMPREVESFLASLKTVAADWPLASVVAVATTGYVRDGIVYAVNRTTIPFLDGFPIEKTLRETLHCPVYTINDGQAAAWGEYLNQATPVRNLLYITLSTGVGGGLVLNGLLQIGPGGLCGHIGHVSVRRAKAHQLCGCGRSGCVEAVASGTALGRQATAVFGRTVDSRALIELASRDPRAEGILANAAEAVAEAIANAHALLDLQRVVIGGSVGLADGMVERIHTALESYPLLFRVPLVAARLGANSGLVGAALWADACSRSSSLTG
jgi:N-acylmannosamine kinase